MNYREEVLKRFNISIEEINLLEEATEDIYKINSFKKILEHLTQYVPTYYNLFDKTFVLGATKELQKIRQQIDANINAIELNLAKYEDKIRGYKIHLIHIQDSRAERGITIPSIVIIDKNNLVEFKLIFNKYNKVLGLILDRNRSNRAFERNLSSYISKYKEELKLANIRGIYKGFDYVKRKGIVQSSFTLEDIKNEVFEDVLDKYIRIIDEYDKYLEDLKEQKLGIYLTKEDIKGSYKYDNDKGCCIDGCNNISEYAIFEYNKNTGKRHPKDEYICSKHLEEYESNKDDNDNILRQYYKRNFKVEKNILKTIAEKEKKDYINVTKDIDTFVELIKNENLTLPMNIGIFGDWGSGKSFFIDDIHDKIKNDKNILSVKFNAWNYYDSDITTNLVHNIFKELYNKIDKIEENESILKNSPYHEKFEEYKNNRNKEIKSIEDKINELQDKKNKNNIKELIKVIEPFIDTDDFNQICSIKSDEKYFKDIKEIYIHIQGLINKNILNRLIKNTLMWSVIIICILFIIKQTLRWESVTLDICSIIGVALSNFNQYIKELNDVKLKESISKLRIGLDERSNEINKIELLKQEKQNLESQDNESIEIDFILNMIEDKCNKYDEKVGFISTIKKDIDNLEFLKGTENDNFIQDKRIDKIVLIIDDLDRCPSKKVVEVLQTIQLLLSTEMFIVIIAIDTKWVNKCITSEYSDMITDDNDLFAINYLEKIIHIPFWIESLDNKNSFKFIEKMCEITNSMKNDNEETITEENSDDTSNTNEDENTTESKDMATNEVAISIDIDLDNSGEGIKEKEEVKEEEPIKNINLTPDDLEILRNMEFLLDDVSPRRIKRFFNTILLIKLKYRTDRFRYKNLLFIATSIVLKPEYSCQLYRDIIASSINDDIKTIGIFMENYIENKDKNSREFKYLEAFSKYIEKNMLTDLEIDKFKNYIHEAARYTYYYEEIFKYNNKDKSKNEQNSNNKNLLQLKE